MIVVDIFRLLPARLFGYGFAIGEAMRYGFSYRAVELAYNIGTGFVIVHVLHSTITALEYGTASALVAFADTMCWEGLASCILPTVFNYYICRFTADTIWDIEGVPGVVKRWAPFLVGLCALPLYLRYVDPFVTRLLLQLFFGRHAYYYREMSF